MRRIELLIVLALGTLLLLIPWKRTDTGSPKPPKHGMSVEARQASEASQAPARDRNLFLSRLEVKAVSEWSESERERLRSLEGHSHGQRVFRLRSKLRAFELGHPTELNAAQYEAAARAALAKWREKAALRAEHIKSWQAADEFLRIRVPASFRLAVRMMDCDALYTTWKQLRFHWEGEIKRAERAASIPPDYRIRSANVMVEADGLVLYDSLRVFNCPG